MHVQHRCPLHSPPGRGSLQVSFQLVFASVAGQDLGADEPSVSEYTGPRGGRAPRGFTPSVSGCAEPAEGLRALAVARACP